MRLQLIKKIQENAGAMSFFFKPENDFIFKPGQFLRYHLADTSPDERGENRFFTIAAAPFEKTVRITTKLVPEGNSTFKNDLKKMNPGDYIEAFGPSGSFTLEDPEKQYVFIAGGIGITPFRSILLDLDNRGKPLNVTLLYANKTGDIVFKDELETLAGKHPEFKICFLISEEKVEEQQLSENVKIIPGKISDELIKKLIPDFKSPTYFVSGPEPMVKSLGEMLQKIGVEKENIKRDEFPGYENY